MEASGRLRDREKEMINIMDISGHGFRVVLYENVCQIIWLIT